MPPLKRRRATAIVEHLSGIVIVLMRHMAGMLPGGGVKPGETDQAAAIRELMEETGLIANHVVFLFHYESYAHINAVFWIMANGQPTPCNEIDQIVYYQEGSHLRLSPDTQAILRRFYQLKSTEPGRFVLLREMRA